MRNNINWLLEEEVGNRALEEGHGAPTRSQPLAPAEICKQCQGHGPSPVFAPLHLL